MGIVEFGDWPGRIVHGVGATARLEPILREAGAARALVVCGATVAGGPLLAAVRQGLGDGFAGVFAEVEAHAPVDLVRRAIDRYRAVGAEAVVSVGGGSAIDAAKGIAILLADRGDLEDYAIRYEAGGEMRHAPIPVDIIRHIAVPTTAGSASDVMPTAGLRDPERGRKLLFWDRKLVPFATVLDPAMAIHAGPKLTAASGMTAVARCVEALYSGKRHPLSTALALHALRLLSRALPRSVEAPSDLEARAACQMACAMSGIAAINAMVSLVHAIGHVVGGRYGLQHGISHAILLPAAVRLLGPGMGDEQDLMLEALGGGTVAPSAGVSDAAAAQLAALLARLPLPQRLREVGVEEADLPELAAATMNDYMMANLPRPLDEGDVGAILRSAW